MLALAKILLPTDFSNRCRGAARVVRALTKRFEAEVTVLHVLPTRDSALSERAREELEAVAAFELGGCKVTRCVATGEPGAAIVEQAKRWGASMIVMPTHGLHPFQRFMLGPVAAEVLRDADCPVWTSALLEDLPVIERVALRHILCAVNFGPRSCKTLRWAGRVAGEFGAKLTVAHVLPPTDMFPSEADELNWRTESLRAAAQQIRNLQETVGVPAQLEISDGNPATALLETAEDLDVDLLVIGRTHGSTGAAEEGGHACSIIAHSPCPVLSV